MGTDAGGSPVTAPFDLTSWRHTVVRGGLPAPRRAERSQPLPAGVVNLWEYDAAEVWYADGRPQLQGANEPGKSALIALDTVLPHPGHNSTRHMGRLGTTE